MLYQKPYTFRAGTYAKSSEVNANFDTMKNFVDDLQDYIENVEISSAPYNKANRNGSSSEKFQVANGTSNNDAVNLGQLTTVQTGLNTRVTALESAGSWVPPNYSSYVITGDSGTFSSDGVVYVRNNLASHNDQTMTIGSFEFTLKYQEQMCIPIKSGTTYSGLGYTCKFFAS